MPELLETDDDSAFKGEFAASLLVNHIPHRRKDRKDTRAIALVDRWMPMT